MYMYQFFKTESEAKAFVKSGTDNKRAGQGALYKNVKGSRTKRDYAVEMTMMAMDHGKPESWFEERPYCVAWNHN